MTFIPGNKAFIALSIICFMMAGLCFGAVLAQKKTEISLSEKRLEKTVSALTERNAGERAGIEKK